MDYKALAIQAEDNFNFEKALEYYEKAFKELSVEDGSLIRYANLLFEFQEYDKAREIFEIIVDSIQEREYLFKLAQIYEELDLRKKAIDIYEKLGNDEKVKELKDQELQLQPSREILIKFIELFSGREDVFAVQDEIGYHPVRRPINFKDVIEHLNAEKTLGVYVLRSDNCVKFALYDVDIKKQFISGVENIYKYDNICKSAVKELCNILAGEGITYHLEYSGWRGYHIWLFFSEWIQAYKVKGLLEALIKDLQVPEEVNIEVFPKQSDLNGGLGNLVKLPLGVHLKTLKKCSFLTENFEVIPNQIEYLLSIEPIERKVIEELYYKFLTESESNLSINQVIQKSKRKKSNNTKKNLRREIQNQLPKNTFLSMISACFVLKQINDKIEKFAYVNDDEEYIFIKSCSPLDNSKEFLSEFLKKTVNYSSERIKSIIQNSEAIPITCEEIKRIVLNKSLKIDLSKCNCKFDGNYNTPCALVKNVEEIYTAPLKNWTSRK